jgi:hypothetical protein
MSWGGTPTGDAEYGPNNEVLVKSFVTKARIIMDDIQQLHIQEDLVGEADGLNVLFNTQYYPIVGGTLYAGFSGDGTNASSVEIFSVVEVSGVTSKSRIVDPYNITLENGVIQFVNSPPSDGSILLGSYISSDYSDGFIVDMLVDAIMYLQSLYDFGFGIDYDDLTNPYIVGSDTILTAALETWILRSFKLSFLKMQITGKSSTNFNWRDGEKSVNKMNVTDYQTKAIMMLEKKIQRDINQMILDGARAGGGDRVE